MHKQLQKQLNHQRQRLQLELPPSTSRILSKLLKRDNDNEFNSVEYENGFIEMGALPTPASETARVAVKLIIPNIFYTKKKQLNARHLLIKYYTKFDVLECSSSMFQVLIVIVSDYSQSILFIMFNSKFSVFSRLDLIFC